MVKIAIGSGWVLPGWKWAELFDCPNGDIDNEDDVNGRN